MKYITEEDLRDLYRKAPFTKYDLEPGVRLTPGARQFLIDKGMNTFDNEYPQKQKNEDAGQIAETGKIQEDCFHKKLILRMKSIEASFLETERELIHKDICLAQSVIRLGKQLGCIRNAVKNKASLENLSCNECTGINCNNFSEDLDDCFEITEFHIQLDKGQEMIALHKLRCELNELAFMIQELYEGKEAEQEFVKEINGKVYQLINSLSRLICAAFGGKVCQRQG